MLRTSGFQSQHIPFENSALGVFLEHHWDILGCWFQMRDIYLMPDFAWTLEVEEEDLEIEVRERERISSVVLGF